MSELKPCPFCGAAPRRSLAQPKNGPDSYAIGCSKCILVTEWVADDAEAITAWNTRTTDPEALEAAFRLGLEAAAGVADKRYQQWGCAGGFEGHTAGAHIIRDSILAIDPAQHIKEHGK